MHPLCPSWSPNFTDFHFQFLFDLTYKYKRHRQAMSYFHPPSSTPLTECHQFTIFGQALQMQVAPNCSEFCIRCRLMCQLRADKPLPAHHPLEMDGGGGEWLRWIDWRPHLPPAWCCINYACDLCAHSHGVQSCLDTHWTPHINTQIYRSDTVSILIA